MKKIILSTALLLSMLFLNSCLKDKGFENSEYGLNPAANNSSAIVQFLGGGFPFFAKDQLLKADPTKARDTAYLQIFYVNNGLPTANDVTIKFAISPAALTEFNSDPNKADFDRLPDSTFIFTQTSAVVKAGQSYSAKIPFIFFPGKVDPSKLYMLPIRITDGGGNIISSNSSTFYIHIVGNPLAGSYVSDGYFYHPTVPRAINALHKDLAAIDDIFVETNLGDLAAPISISIDASNNVFIAYLNGNVGIGPTSLFLVNPSYTPFPGSNPAIYTNKYDPVTKTFYLRYGYPGGSGLLLVEEKLVRQ